VRRGVVLLFLPRLEVVPAHRRLGLLADPFAATERGQGGVGQRGAAGHQLLMDSDQVPLADIE